MSRSEIEQALRGELVSGERLLWSGQPRQGLCLRPSDALMIPFSLLWGGFAIFWEVSVLRGGAPLFMALWGIPFVLVGLYMIAGRFVADAKVRRQTFYGLTNSRIVIVSGLFSRTVRSLELRALPEVSLREGSAGSGTVMFGRPSAFGATAGASSWPRSSDTVAPAFDMIADARAVYNQVRSAQSALLANPTSA